MSVTDDVRAADSRASGSPPARDAQFDRTPPQDIAAEQCVLGGMLISKDAIADVVEILRSTDFYRPPHVVVFDAILDLYGRGEPADAVTVAAALADSGDLARIGGAAYLHTLMAAVPTAANAAYYARIVSERAVLRRLVEAGTRIVQLGYGSAAGTGRDVDDVVDLAQQAVYDVTERRVSEDFAVLSDLLQPTLDEIEAVGAQGGVMTGVPTGFTDLDRLLNGLHAGQLIVVAGRPGLGKALALDTPLPTPDGWTTMGKIRVGDRLLGADGRPTTVTDAFDVMHGRPCYEVEFSDGSVIVADADHLWRTTTRASRRQASETEGVHEWPADARAAVDAAYTLVMAAPDALVSFSAAVDLVGERFRNVMHVLAREVGSAGHVTRGYVRRGRPWRRVVPAYSQQVLIGALRRRVNRLRNAETTADHRRTITTKEIAATVYHPTNGRVNHAVENCRPLDLPERELSIPPYTLGAWLGDGSANAARITTVDPEILSNIEADGFTVRHSSLTGRLRAVGVLGNKHIPRAYLRASEAQRRALLSGLLDTGGTVGPTGNVQFCSTSQRLAEEVFELVVSFGYPCTINQRRVNDRSEATSTAYVLTFTTLDDVFRLERKRAAHQQRRRAADTVRTGLRYITDVREVPSVPVRCLTVDNADHLYLAGRAMIPTHNSTVSMDFARNAAVRFNLASAIFSLEMSKVEIVMRLLSAEARVPLHVLRSGQLSDDDWTKLARRMGEISEAPLFVDDTPNMNLMEIRAKARRLKQRHDLKLVVVDYLQLMTSPKRTESRQQEVADLSRGLKLLAKEIECPVVAVSQLNRGPEQRNDKRPQLSDLRESGCLTADTRLMRADTNAEVSLGELLASGARDVPVWGLDDGLRYTPRTLTHVFPSGRRPVFRLRLASGKTIDGTRNHPFLTYAGWTPLGELAVGSRVAVPRHIPPPLHVHPQATDTDAAGMADRAHGMAEQGPGGGLPSAVFGMPKAQVGIFLRRLWTLAGSTTPSDGSTTSPCYSSSDRRMLEDVSRLLLRYGISARLRTAATVAGPTSYLLEVCDPDDQRRLRRGLGLDGDPAAGGGTGARGGTTVGGGSAAGAVSRWVWREVRDILLTAPAAPAARPRSTGTQALPRIAGVLHAADLDLYATNDVLWDDVVAIEARGEQDVFDATVLGVHNFVANGIATHNSIEQDADVVILLHRDDYYDKESPRAGEADFIVAKHRNGPTDTITVAAQLHLSRFVDMAVV